MCFYFVGNLLMLLFHHPHMNENPSNVVLLHVCAGMEHELMLKELSDLAVEGRLKAPKCTEVSLKDYKEVLAQAMKPYINSKYIFVFH